MDGIKRKTIFVNEVGGGDLPREEEKHSCSMSPNSSSKGERGERKSCRSSCCTVEEEIWKRDRFF